MAVAVDLDAVVTVLRDRGAKFAYVFGSRADGGPGGDTDVAAWWGGGGPTPWSVGVPDGVDLLVLDDAPLELAGRVAAGGRLLFEDDPPARVAWEAQTRKVWFDERPRTTEARRLALESLVDRGRR